MSRTLEVSGNCHVWPRCMISKDNVSSSHALWCLLIYYFSTFRNKLLVPLTIVTIFFSFKVRVINRSRRLRLITPTSTLIILDITKTSSNNCLILTNNQLTNALSTHDPKSFQRGLQIYKYCQGEQIYTNSFTIVVVKSSYYLWLTKGRLINQECFSLAKENVPLTANLLIYVLNR